jgi:Stress responsive A/B Barrel Domain
MFRKFASTRYSFVLLVSLFSVSSLAICFRNAQGQQEKQETKLLRHVVMFQFKATSSEADVKTVVDEFRALPTKISQIADFEYGTNNSPEGLTGGLTHVFLVTFKSEADRAVYLPHAAHLAFIEVLKPHLEKATVIDYWAAK